MEAKLGQNAGDLDELLVYELNPNPLADDFSQRKKARSFTA
jgi:hypothetical protein